ncbi:ABC transporter permease [Paenibacillus sepulcri]|uniref:ABC transporter permease n=1 Tax=Paenibacillus sepulcri TaxID=359917 RepID=A0ABS7C5B8_9BACL|nr:ABC transporter permease [Paenibacillus sepulcri]
MFPVFLAQWMKDRRSPVLVLVFLAISIGATLLSSSLMGSNKMKIDVFGDQGLTKAEAESWIDRLNQSEAYQFKLRDEKQARLDVREGRVDVAVKLMAEDYRMIAAVDGPNVEIVERQVHAVFEKELKLRAAAEQAKDASGFRQAADHDLQQPALTLRTQSLNGQAIAKYDMSVHYLFGFTLFLVIFTIGFKVSALTSEKASGIWNRVILSPVRKTEMYLGHLLYSSLVGFAQIAIVFLVFRYGFGYQLGEQFGMLLILGALYTFAMVAFAMLLAGVLRTPEQFNSVLPAIVPIMPMLGGVYVPPGTLTNPIILGLAQIFPLTHALQALTGVAIYEDGWSDVLMPAAKLLLIGVVCLGVGINLMERQKA